MVHLFTILLLLLSACTHTQDKNRAISSSQVEWESSLKSPYNFYKDLFGTEKKTVLFLGEYHVLSGHKETLKDIAKLASEGLIDRIIFEQILGNRNSVAQAYLEDKSVKEETWQEAYYFCKMARHRNTYNGISIKDHDLASKEVFKRWFDKKVSEGLPKNRVSLIYCEAQGLHTYFRLFKKAKETNPKLKVCGMELFIQDDQHRMTDQQELEKEKVVFQNFPKKYRELGMLPVENGMSEHPNTRDLYMSLAVSRCLLGSKNGVVYSGSGHSRKWLSIPGVVPVLLRDIFEYLNTDYKIFSAMTLSDGRGDGSVRTFDDAGKCSNCDIFPNFNPEFQAFLERFSSIQIGFSKELPDSPKKTLVLGDDYLNMNLTDMFEIFIYRQPEER